MTRIGRVFLGRPVADLSMAEPLRAQLEDAPHHWRVVVWDQFAVDSVVSSPWSVGPHALAGGFGHAHDDVLAQLLAEELSERAEEVIQERGLWRSCPMRFSCRDGCSSFDGSKCAWLRTNCYEVVGLERSDVKPSLADLR
jgi:hypothetical protein